MKNENENENLKPETLGIDTQSENNASALDATQDALSELALEALENSPIKEEVSETSAPQEPTPMAPPVTTFQTTPEEAPKKKNYLPIILLALVVIAATAFGIFYFLGKKELTPKERYAKILNDAYASASPYLTNDVKYDFTKPFALSLDASMDTTIDEVKDFSGYHVKANLGFDMEGKKASLQLNLQDKNKKDILSAKAGADDKNIYIASEKLYDKTIKVSNVMTEFWKALEDPAALGDNPNALFEINLPENIPSGKDIDHFIKLVKDTIIKNINDDTIKTTDERITLGGKEETVTKLSYILDQKETEKQMKAIVTAIKADETSMNLLATLTEQSKNEVEEALDEELESIDVTTPVSFDLYVKDNELVQAEFGPSKDNLFRYTVNDKKSNIIFISENENIFEINIDETNKKQTLVTFDMDGLNAKLTLREYNENKVDMDYNITVENQTVSGTVNVTADKDKLSGAFSVATTVEGKEMKVNMEMEVTPNVTVTLPTTTNAIEYTQLTETDMATIMTNVQNAIKGTSLEALLTSIMGTGDMQM